MKPAFHPGKNIAMKIPTHEYEHTLRFYREILRFEELSARHPDDTPRFRFGDKVLWLDCMPGLSQSEIWLEVLTDDIEQAADYFKASGCQRRDEIEPLPEGMKAFWVSSPSNIIHLVTEGNSN
ncbi:MULTISPECIES: VOC family protein [unclassified Ketobacter]|uniref:VOC family protein n=1 Tax=unclassified Ketobacter TaxID=2639109 RepID=UPI000F14EACA|nr:MULTISPECIES: hypothetical protein [unclassified Ketobacter]MCK5789925.1 hypothetical protein [Ketobacter sp.]RLT89331.1 MAG: hypothetical protein D9N13_13490 [Ketobacter sp. GenoA1]RLT95823.1 MAG: hypothetical protein D9N15_13360 [Ketobacter sp.]